MDCFSGGGDEIRKLVQRDRWVNMETKTCTKCQENKSIDEFHRVGIRGRHSWCKACFNEYHKVHRNPESTDIKRNRNYKGRYGLNDVDIKRMLDEQSGCCAICGMKLTKKYCVDHNHITGEIRDILCHRCNLVIGGLDDVNFRQKVNDYLESHDNPH